MEESQSLACVNCISFLKSVAAKVHPEKKQCYLVPETTILKWMFGETTVSYVKNWTHPVETTNKKWLFGVPGIFQ